MSEPLESDCHHATSLRLCNLTNSACGNMSPFMDFRKAKSRNRRIFTRPDALRRSRLWETLPMRPLKNNTVPQFTDGSTGNPSSS